MGKAIQISLLLLFAALLSGQLGCAEAAACDTRANDTQEKLLECVTIEGVREHLEAFQTIADANEGTRAAGTPGYDASVAYVAERLEEAGYDVELNSFEFRGESTHFNVLAELPGGDAGNVVMIGAHLDSVRAGPGINDNGSGSAAILEVAEQMAKAKPHNTVRFAWWGAEESFMVGSRAYVSSLTEEEQENIAQYINFDMIGSTNHIFFIYDGDDSDEEGAGPGPEGSAEIEKLFESYYTDLSLPFQGVDFTMGSDFIPFMGAGIPSGGLFSGCCRDKTDEEVTLWGGTVGDQYDPCYHQACDNIDNINFEALDVNADAVAFATFHYAMNAD
jgi:Zn-dependent M28 family amino/carboxypeptidase